jgi:hypothetical protein
VNEPAEAFHPLPPAGAVARQNLRAVAESVRWEAAAAVALMATLLLMIVLGESQGSSGADYDVADMTWPVVILGLFAPMSVWKGEEPSRRSYLWSMPVDRFRHTLLKVASGWSVLMVLVAVYVLWAMAVALVTGGHITINPEWEAELMRDLPPGTLIRDMTLSGHPWLWLVPFTAATTTYLLGTVLALLTDHPLRVVAGTAFAFFLVIGLAESSGGTTEQMADDLFMHLVAGPYGIVTQATGILHSFEDAAPGVLKNRPSLGAWARATLLWAGAGLVGVVLAARTHQER